jgi:hypothetical protein
VSASTFASLLFVVEISKFQNSRGGSGELPWIIMKYAALSLPHSFVLCIVQCFQYRTGSIVQYDLLLLDIFLLGRITVSLASPDSYCCDRYTAGSTFSFFY